MALTYRKPRLHRNRHARSQGQHRSEVSRGRNPEQTDDGSANGGHPVVLDVEDSSTGELDGGARRPGLVGGRGVGVMNTPTPWTGTPPSAPWTRRAAPASTGTSVSYIGAGPDHGVPEDDPFAYAEAKAAADEYRRSTDLDWTISARAGSRWRSRTAGSRPR